ncbi:hypothetical protein [Parachitinimonas caeni]|uniref:Uncharacterized protein n=1 Tax=Parachitinimonas caeni TaxID=3031301 RepID=A0ABT7DZU8_9NEIS|nr:hypothetical protein [Parachitinimonas caeni]MDK2125349.1 hypothetical protein [Parachitinimonas caeni]
MSLSVGSTPTLPVTTQDVQEAPKTSSKGWGSTISSGFSALGSGLWSVGSFTVKGVVGTVGTGVGVVETLGNTVHAGASWAGGYIDAPATEKDQTKASATLRGAKVVGSESQAETATIRRYVRDNREVLNAGSLGGTLKLKEDQDLGTEISTNLESYIMRGAHCVAKDDGGALYLDMINELTGQNFASVEEVTQNLTKDQLPEGGIERGGFTPSSHYAKGKPGHIEGARQFGMDIEGAGHLLFGLRKTETGVESWFQFEGHGVATAREFTKHGGDFLAHKATGSSQVGPQGYCKFTENNNKEIILGASHEEI